MSRLEDLRTALAARAGGPGGPGLPARGARGPIGLHWADGTLHLVQLKLDREGPTPAAVARVALGDAEGADPAVLRRGVREALRAGGFRGRRIVTSLEPPDVKLMVLDYTEGADSAESAIVRLVEERIDEPVQEMVIDYLPVRALGESTRQRSALVAVARHETVVERLERLRGAGLEVEALEITPVAIRRLSCGLALRERIEENALALYAGRRRSHLIVLWGRRLVLYREIDFGAAAAEERVSKALDLADGEAAGLLARHGVGVPEAGETGADASAGLEVAETIREILKPSFYQLADEIERARVYTASRARGAAPVHVYLLGAFAGWPRAERLLASLGPLPATRLDLGASLGDARLEGVDTVATGLALRGLVHDG